MLTHQTTDSNSLDRQVNALFAVLAEIHGADQLVLKAGKLDSLTLMRSEKLEERVLALERIVHEDPTIEQPRALDEIPEMLDDLAEHLIYLPAAPLRKSWRRRSAPRCKNGTWNT
jgi:ATP-dependent Lon protease